MGVDGSNKTFDKCLTRNRYNLSNCIQRNMSWSNFGSEKSVGWMDQVSGPLKKRHYTRFLWYCAIQSNSIHYHQRAEMVLHLPHPTPNKINTNIRYNFPSPFRFRSSTNSNYKFAFRDFIAFTITANGLLWSFFHYYSIGVRKPGLIANVMPSHILNMLCREKRIVLNLNVIAMLIWKLKTTTNHLDALCARNFRFVSFRYRDDTLRSPFTAR